MEVRMVGDCVSLGVWCVEKARRMHWDNDMHGYTAVVSLPLATHVEYKCVM